MRACFSEPSQLDRPDFRIQTERSRSCGGSERLLLLHLRRFVLSVKHLGLNLNTSAQSISLV
ncbi:hypothetical protein DPMN_096144 [Dreissena polymorpha]|uniref:Uncharacterized protein n=1 Tax=Dreissena polymorpha TaxID=45954 RepID=A0A9D4L972_DREPO|nr:hypothetical protein DPMN_096144 [Dreissena polymorpha]